MSLLASLSLSTDPYNKKDRLVVSLASSSPLHWVFTDSLESK